MNRWKRFWLVVAAFGAAWSVAFLNYAGHATSNVNVAAALFGLVIFPAALWFWVLPNPGPPILIGGGWLIYLALAVGIVLAQSVRTSRRLFILLILLLIANVAGCISAGVPSPIGF